MSAGTDFDQLTGKKVTTADRMKGKGKQVSNKDQLDRGTEMAQGQHVAPDAGGTRQGQQDFRNHRRKR